MSKGINKVILVGNLGKDPEVQYLEGGVAVAKFPLATTESYKNKQGERVDQTEWHNVVLWRGLAEVAEKYVKKGSRVYIEGKIRTRSYDDKDGNKKWFTEIVGDNMVMLDSRGENQDGGGYQAAGPGLPEPSVAGKSINTQKAEAGAGGYEDDLPF
jgi:single-strand DNA-binding protein